MDTKATSPAEIIDRFLTTAPVDVYRMASALGISVERKLLADDVSGKIECEISGPCRITVNALHSPTRQRFTLAHEIAHFVLHRDLIGDGVVDGPMYRSATLSDSVERQANRYAASLLMPVHLVREAWERGVQTKEKLAELFGVSEDVAKIRMSELGCVLWPKVGPVSFGRH